MEIDDIDSLRKWWSNSLEHIINVQNRVSMTDTESSNEFVIISKKNDEETSMTKTEAKIASSVKSIKGTNIKTCPVYHIYVKTNNHAESSATTVRVVVLQVKMVRGCRGKKH
jgi:hypothetical protein